MFMEIICVFFYKRKVKVKVIKLRFENNLMNDKYMWLSSKFAENSG